MKYTYIKLNEKGEIVNAPQHDLDGKITGKCIYGLVAWFDENPEERKRLGWIKKIHAEEKDIEYDPQTQFLVRSQRMDDEYTLVEEYHVLNKTETMMAHEEETAGVTLSVSDWFFLGE